MLYFILCVNSKKRGVQGKQCYLQFTLDHWKTNVGNLSDKSRKNKLAFIKLGYLCINGTRAAVNSEHSGNCKHGFLSEAFCLLFVFSALPAMFCLFSTSLLGSSCSPCIVSGLLSCPWRWALMPACGADFHKAV